MELLPESLESDHCWVQASKSSKYHFHQPQQAPPSFYKNISLSSSSSSSPKESSSHSLVSFGVKSAYIQLVRLITLRADPFVIDKPSISWFLSVLLKCLIHPLLCSTQFSI